MSDLKGKYVLITGAGGGIGKAIVEQFSSQGAHIIATDINAESLTEVQQIAQSAGVEYYPLYGDLGDSDFCDQLPELAFKASDQLDILINNAGVMRRGNILEASDEDWHLSMTINVEAVFRICRSAIAIMQDHGGGAIVNTASCWGVNPGPNHLIYCTTKAAVATMSRCLGLDHAHAGIRVNAVCPNEVNTPMLRSGFKLRGFDPDSAVQELGKTVPLGRIAEAEDIADVIVFLASDQSRYITGATIEVNGGKAVY